MVGSCLVNMVSVHWNSHLRTEFSPEVGQRGYNQIREMPKQTFNFFLESTLSILIPGIFFLLGKLVCYQFPVTSEINVSSAVQGRVYNVKISISDTEATVWRNYGLRCVPAFTCGELQILVNQ